MKLFPPTPALAEFTRAIERLVRDNTSITGLPTYADDAAAGTAGLTVGQLYKTATGQVMVKL